MADDSKAKERLTEGTAGGTGGTGETQTTGSGAGAGAAGTSDEAIVGRGAESDDTGGLAGAHQAGEVSGRDGGATLGSAIPQDEVDPDNASLGDASGETPGGTDTVDGSEAIGRSSPGGGDPGGMGGTREGRDTHGRPPGGVSPMGGSREGREDER